MDLKEKNEFLLTQLIFMFQSAALQQMGKLKNPMTDKIDRDLSQAQISIDMLEMIHTKTRGNLSAEEENIFKRVLQELRLNYVDEATKEQQELSKSAGENPTAQATMQSGDKPQETKEPVHAAEHNDEKTSGGNGSKTETSAGQS